MEQRNEKLRKLYSMMRKEKPTVASSFLIDRLIEEAHEKWDIGDARVLHRVGRLDIGQAAVVIAVSAAHREEALAAVRFLIEQIKSRVPIWKKQIFESGENEWVVCHHSAGYIA